MEYFFDPTLILEDSTSSSSFKKSTSNLTLDSESPLLNSKHLYVPCKIVKSLSEGSDGKDAKVEVTSGPALVKTKDGTLYKIREAKELTALTEPDDYVGMSDVLHLANISEASLLHSLRVRY